MNNLMTCLKLAVFMRSPICDCHASRWKLLEWSQGLLPKCGPPPLGLDVCEVQPDPTNNIILRPAASHKAHFGFGVRQ